ncbi:MAG TPA: ketopantoate reductase family protein [Patescibacteria group bacterium]|nr:ketopantoate reductase family protein [Patescibacteria group bacterium]
MKIAVVGAGAIGTLVAGYLKLKGEEVTLVGRPDSVKVIKEEGLRISGVRGDFQVKLEAHELLDREYELVVFAVKTQDMATALKDNSAFLGNAVVLTTQNGVQADRIASGFIDKQRLVSSIVMFGATLLEPAKVVHNFEGSLIIGRPYGTNDKAVLDIRQTLSQVFPVIVSDAIEGMKYLKVFVNANNCIPAILGVSMQEAFGDLQVSRISIAVWREGLEIARQAGVNLVALPDFPLERLTQLASMPLGKAAVIFSGIMTGLSKEPLYGSILQSIKRNRTSEIDYINGEFVRLAQAHHLTAPLNERLVEMVHEVEKKRRFFPKEELVHSTQGLLG